MNVVLDAGPVQSCAVLVVMLPDPDFGETLQFLESVVCPLSLRVDFDQGIQWRVIPTLIWLNLCGLHGGCFLIRVTRELYV